MDNLHEDFTKGGVIGDMNMIYLFRKAYSAPVPKETVYNVYLRLRKENFMPMYTSLTNTATLKLTNALLLTVNRFH